MSLNKENNDLIHQFNCRINEALSEVYLMFYNELHYYAIGLYQGTAVDPCDAIHDVFLSLWQSNTKFEELINIKAYLFISIRNSFRQFLSKNKSIDKFKEFKQYNNELFAIDVIESEVLSTIHQVLRLLPQESAEILQLFFDGWDIDEIATKLNKTKRTIYNKKSDAIAILRNKLPKDKLLIFMLLIN